MNALDTNILARYLLRDDARQSLRACALLKEDQTYWIPITVILELAWVLRSDGVPRSEIAQRLQELLELPGVHVQLSEAVSLALAWVKDGLDVPDAIHLALSQKTDKFVTFDRDLVKRAAALRISPPVLAG